MKTIVKTNNPGYPVEFNFVDEQFDQLFKTETLIGKLAGVFAILAIVISCLGLFGLSAYTAERRTKEIGIRKVLGASSRQTCKFTFKRLSQTCAHFLPYCFSACMVDDAQLAAEFEYRIQINWWIFFIAGLLACLIALITVSFQAIRAAVANPAKSLSTE